MSYINVKDRLPDVYSDKFKIETDTGEIFDCYFYADAMAWTAFYGQKTCHWWNCKTLEPVFNVIRWKEKEKIETI